MPNAEFKKIISIGPDRISEAISKVLQKNIFTEGERVSFKIIRDSQEVILTGVIRYEGIDTVSILDDSEYPHLVFKHQVIQ
jgi:hypothetical protein